MRYFFAVLWNLFVSVVWISQVHACPCGCSVAGPLSFQAAGQMRVVSQLGTERPLGSYDAEGDLYQERGPDQILEWSQSLGYALNAAHSISATVPLLMNARYSGERNTSLGDPSLGWRYGIPGAIIVGDGWISSSLTLASKFPVAKSVNEMSEDPYSMDIHGNGYYELAAGVDTAWTNAVWTVTPGAGVIWRNPRWDTIAGEYIRRTPGLGTRADLSVGYNWIGSGELKAFVRRDWRGQDQLADRLIEDSGSLSHSLGVVTSLRIAEQTNMSVQLLRKGLTGLDYGATRLFSVRVSVEKTLS